MYSWIATTSTPCGAWCSKTRMPCPTSQAIVFGNMRLSGESGAGAEAGICSSGAPNERSTAQPVRDFYLYFLQPFDAPYFKDEKKADEVVFRLKDRDDAFDRPLRVYAGAREQAAAASGSNKKIYEDKAGDHLRTLTSWLREHMPTSVEVVHQGRSKTLQEVVRGKLPPNATVKDYVNTAGSALLAPHFADRSPEYPIFSVLVTRQNRDQAAQEALRWIAGGVKSKQGTAIIDALELLDGETLKPRNSRYAKHVLDALSQKGQGQVLNRSELVASEAGVDYWTKFRIEPEFLSVVLVSRPGNIRAKSLDFRKNRLRRRRPHERGRCALYCSTKLSILLTNSFTLVNDPRRIARSVMIPNHRSTWLIHVAYVGV